MQLNKANDEEKVKIARKYFILGFFLLPFVWLVLIVWFFKEAFLKKNANRMIRRYVFCAIIGFTVWAAVIIVWTSVYQTQRPDWEAIGDYISYTVPIGKR